MVKPRGGDNSFSDGDWSLSGLEPEWSASVQAG